MNEEFAIKLKTILDNSSITEVKQKLSNLTEDIQKKVNDTTSSPIGAKAFSRSISDAKEYSAQIELLKSKIADLETTRQSILNGDFGGSQDLLEVNAQIEKLKNQLGSLEAKQLGDDLEEIKQTTGGIGINLKDVQKTIKKSTNNAKKFVLSLIGARSVWTGIRKAMSSYLSQNEELQSKLNAIWYGLGSLFAPILEWIINLFAKILAYADAIAKALGFAGINMKKYGKAAGAAAKQTKSLASFDEINNIGNNKGGGGGGGAIADPLKDIKVNKGFLDNLKLILDLVKAIAAGFLAWKIANALSSALGLTWDQVLGIAIGVGGATLAVEGFIDAWKNGLTGLNLAEMIGGIALAVTGFGMAFGIVGASITLLIGGLALLTIGLKDFITTGEATVQNTAAVTIGILAIGTALALVMGWVPLIIAAAVAIAAAVVMNWEKIKQALSKVKDWIKINVINPVIKFINGLLVAVEKGVNYIIDILNKLKIDVPDWIPGIGGKTFGFNLEHVTIKQIPTLENGGLAFGETLATVGEYAGAQSNPEVIAPLSTLQNMLGNSNVEELNLLASINQQLIELNAKDIDINLDGESVATTINGYIQNINERNGQRVFALGR